jgi:hypothetical protein
LEFPPPFDAVEFPPHPVSRPASSTVVEIPTTNFLALVNIFPPLIDLKPIFDYYSKWLKSTKEINKRKSIDIVVDCYN